VVVDVVVEVVEVVVGVGCGKVGNERIISLQLRQPSLTTVLVQRSEHCNPKMVGYVMTVTAQVSALGKFGSRRSEGFVAWVLGIWKVWVQLLDSGVGKVRRLGRHLVLERLGAPVRA